jgi:hypothetical protein
MGMTLGRCAQTYLFLRLKHDPERARVAAVRPQVGIQLYRSHRVYRSHRAVAQFLRSPGRRHFALSRLLYREYIKNEVSIISLLI